MTGFFKWRYLQVLTFLLWQFLAKVLKIFPLQYTLAAILVLREVQVTTPSTFDCLRLQVQSRSNYTTLTEGHRLRSPTIHRLLRKFENYGLRWSAHASPSMCAGARVRSKDFNSNNERWGEMSELANWSSFVSSSWLKKWSSCNDRRPAKLRFYRFQSWRCKWNSRLGN